MDLRQLSYFVAVAEELSFSRAAERVHISQPPLSRQIANLEREVGAALLLRSSHEVKLTEAGVALLQEARRLLAIAATIKHTVKRAASGETGTLRIGFVGSAIYTSLPLLLSQYRQLYPAVEVGLQQMPAARQILLLKSGELDVGIVRQPVSGENLESRSLFKERFVAAMPAHHPMARQDSVRLRTLAGEAYVAFSRSEAPAIHEQFIRMCKGCGFEPNVVQEAHPMSTVVGLVAAGVGIAIVPASLRRLDIEGAVYRDLAGTQEKSEYFLAWKGHHCPQTVKNFLALKLQ